jgi:hypothetical protein
MRDQIEKLQNKINVLETNGKTNPITITVEQVKPQVETPKQSTTLGVH